MFTGHAGYCILFDKVMYNHYGCVRYCGGNYISIGIDISISCMLEKLSDIKEVRTVHEKPSQGKRQRQYLSLTEMNDLQRKIFDVLGLKEFKFV